MIFNKFFPNNSKSMFQKRFKLFLLLPLFLMMIMLTSSPIVLSQENSMQDSNNKIETIYVRDDMARAIAIDNLGNVYVTGYSEGSVTGCDIVTIKYDTAGNQKWVKRYNYVTANVDDGANAIAIDSDNNIYVTGRSYGSGTGYDYVTIKYDTAGNQKWVKRYNYATENSYDLAYAIAIDDSNNIYVTGYSYGGSGTSLDIVTIKYDQSGTTQWVKRYNYVTANVDDGANAIAIDSDNNIYVTGRSYGSGTGYDIVTIKYAPGGTRQWVKRYNYATANRSDEAYAIAIDSDNNIYVTGYSDGGSGTGYDIVTIKYDQSGTRQWVKRYNYVTANGNDRNDCANAIAIDSNNNIYVTGYSYGGSGTGYDIVTIKYDQSGTTQWVKRYNYATANGTDEANAIAIDSNNNIYVTGKRYGGSGAYDEIVTIKYDSSGNQKWVKTYNYAAANGSDIAYAIAIDSNNNIYVTGKRYGGSTGYDYVTIKYDTKGNEKWVKRYNGT